METVNQSYYHVLLLIDVYASARTRLHIVGNVSKRLIRLVDITRVGFCGHLLPHCHMI